MEQNNLCHGHTSHSILFQVMVMPSPFSPFHHFSYHRAECLSFSKHLLAVAKKILRSAVLATKRAQAGFIGRDFVSLPSQGTLS